MAYTNQDKYEMALRQARVDIGMGRGNALAKAVDLEVAIIKKLPDGMLSDILKDGTLEKYIYMWADKFAEFNQKRIDEDYKKWLLENDSNLREIHGIEEKITIPISNIKKEWVCGLGHKVKGERCLHPDHYSDQEEHNKTINYYAKDREGTKEKIIKEDLQPF